MRQRNDENVKETSLQTLGKDGDEVLQASEEKVIEIEVVSLQSVKEHCRADTHTAVQGRQHDTRDKHALKKAAAQREPMQEYIFCQEL